jgi:hypothetical protein
MRLTLALGWLVAGCGGSPFTDGCLDRHLDRWCNHRENEEPPHGEGGCAPAELPADAETESCGDYVVLDDVGDYGFTGYNQYFLDGEHVATQYWTDYNHYCGGFVYWYGERVRCD